MKIRRIFALEEHRNSSSDKLSGISESKLLAESLHSVGSFVLYGVRYLLHLRRRSAITRRILENVYPRESDTFRKCH